MLTAIPDERALGALVGGGVGIVRDAPSLDQQNTNLLQGVSLAEAIWLAHPGIGLARQAKRSSQAYPPDKAQRPSLRTAPKGRAKPECIGHRAPSPATEAAPGGEEENT